MGTIAKARVVELVDTQDLKSCSPQRECGFDSRPGHFFFFNKFQVNFSIKIDLFTTN